MKINRSKALKYIRILIYIILLISILLLKYTDLIHGRCFVNDNFGILCPTCGVTRAMKGIANFNFSYAIQKNAYCTLVLFPIFIILLIDDIISMILKKKSFIDIILGEWYMDKAIIGISYILSIYLFYNLIRIRIRKEENRQNRIYLLITLILGLIVVWNIFRQ